MEIAAVANDFGACQIVNSLRLALTTLAVSQRILLWQRVGGTARLLSEDKKDVVVGRTRCMKMLEGPLKGRDAISEERRDSGGPGGGGSDFRR